LRRMDYAPISGILTAYGKGDKARTVRVSTKWMPVVRIWWELRRDSSPGDFLFVDKDSQQLTRRQVSYMIDKLCLDNGLQRFTPHDLRRSFATAYLRRGGDIAKLSRLLGHSSVQVTADRYDRRELDENDDALESMPGPTTIGASSPDREQPEQ
jgi:integrase